MWIELPWPENFVDKSYLIKIYMYKHDDDNGYAKQLKKVYKKQLCICTYTKLIITLKHFFEIIGY